MSRFFDAGSDSDSESTQSDEPERFQQPKLTAAAFAFSDDEEETKRVVRSAKEKRYEELKTYVRNIKNFRKNRDIGSLLTNFEDLWKAFTKAQTVIQKEESGQVPRFYVRCMAEGEDFINSVWEDRNARKNLSKVQSKSLATLRQKLRKYNREEKMAAEIAKFRENPDLPDSDEEEKRAEDSDASDSDDDGASDAEVAPSTGTSKEPSRSREMSKAKDESDSDSDDIDWGSDSDESDYSDDDQDQYPSMRDYFLKKSTDKDDEARKRQKKEERERQRAEERERRRQQEEDDEDEDGDWEKVKKGAPTAKEKLKMFAKDDEVTLNLVNKKYAEISAARGKKGNDRREMIELLHELLTIAEQHNMTPGMIVKIKFGLTAAIFDYNLAIRYAMKPDLWEKVNQRVEDLLDQLLTTPDVIVGENILEENESLEEPPYRVRGCILSVVERLDDEFVKILKNCDAHSNEYFERLRDEHRMVRLIDKAVQLLESRLPKADDAVVELCTTPHEMCRGYLKQVEHIYYKVDKRIFQQAEGEVPADEPTSEQEVDRRCKYIYSNDSTAVLRTRAILYHIYHHALHDHWYEARDLMLMSHLQTNIQNADPVTKIHYNRMMVQLGLCAFRNSQIREAHNALLDIQSSPRVKELLAQGSSQRRDDLTQEQEELNKLREMPYHMHINLELLECVYLVSAMLIEVPYMAAHEFDARRRLISKSFHYQLRNSALKYDLLGPPELMREHVVAASKAMRRGDWRACRDFVIDKTMNAKVWDRFYNGDQPRADKVRAMLTRKIQEETLRTYLFTYSNVYDSVSMVTMSELFELSVGDVHSIVSKMIINAELMASLDEPSQTVVMHRTEPSRLQSMALQLADKLANFVENNERLLEMKQGRDMYYGRGGGGRGFGDRPPFPRGDRVGGGQGGYGRGGGGGGAWGNRRDNRGPPRDQRGPRR
ncbi:eukaryotic translation initiation factor 3 subunit C-like [Amphibalanus amphitrite]|uniref:eukaryotic translation initiation factor 3 subunit C-like n=1 Tax=Amphibalanus amphitrite TaxID=1232801 RepID=UPI001C9198CE|nr:eukaryotic translation initiation factor 3 subunit C-like [Amphibalanus amphitrite]XP_043194450.1 eukaryotic translation initiation factor 3 subunit C-like [Amphibalanus amphitrite]